MLTVHDLFSMNQAIDWPKYFDGVGAPAIAELNVVVPNSFRTLESVLVQTNLDDIKTYLRRHLIHTEVAFLSKAFVDEDFDFFKRTLTGP